MIKSLGRIAYDAAHNEASNGNWVYKDEEEEQFWERAGKAVAEAVMATKPDFGRITEILLKHLPNQGTLGNVKVPYLLLESGVYFIDDLIKEVKAQTEFGRTLEDGIISVVVGALTKEAGEYTPNLTPKWLEVSKCTPELLRSFDGELVQAYGKYTRHVDGQTIPCSNIEPASLYHYGGDGHASFYELTGQYANTVGMEVTHFRPLPQDKPDGV